MDETKVARYYVVIVGTGKGEAAHGPMTSAECDAFLTALDAYAPQIRGKKTYRDDIDATGLAFRPLNYHSVETKL